MRRTKERGLSWMVFSAACALSSAAHGQQTPRTQRFALDQFHPSPAGDRFFAVQGGDVGGHMNPRLMLLGDYAHRPLVLQLNPGEQDMGAVVSDQMFLHLGAGIGLWDRFSVSLNLPIALLTQGEDPSADGVRFPSPSGAALGDLRLGGRARIAGKASSAATLSVAGYLWFPTGDRTKFAGDKTKSALPALVFAGETDSFAYALNAGIALRPQATFGNTTIGNQLVFGGAFGLLLAKRKLQVGPELYGAAVMGGNDAFSSSTTNLEAILGGRYRAGPMVLGAGIGPGLTHGMGTPSLRAVASVAFVPEVVEKKPGPRDADHDGIVDPKDACPLDAGPKSDDPEENGCPDLDKDGIRDPKDACVDKPGPENEDPKLNGCPPDRDGDGILDEDDACPKVKGEKNEDPKLNGCPPDRDGDGIVDDEDACPDTKGVKSEDKTRNGCPGDTDGDGIMDDEDACPQEKGQSNPDPKKNGCPSLVRVTEKEIVILEQVQFKTASDAILTASDELLTQVANVLREHPEILKLEVQGHTDNRGGAAYNKKLSQRRAASVVKWLTTKGEIDATRLTPQGYGMDDPLGDNATDEGRQKNRRVQFKITETRRKSEAGAE